MATDFGKKYATMKLKKYVNIKKYVNFICKKYIVAVDASKKN